MLGREDYLAIGLQCVEVGIDLLFRSNTEQDVKSSGLGVLARFHIRAGHSTPSMRMFACTTWLPGRAADTGIGDSATFSIVPIVPPRCAA